MGVTPTPVTSRLSFVLAMIALLAAAWYSTQTIFFPMHGTKDFPLFLAIIAAVLIVIPGLLDFRKLPKNALAGYILGFVVAVLFASKGIDPGGGETSNFWVIWGGVFLILCLRGVIATAFARTIRSR